MRLFLDANFPILVSQMPLDYEEHKIALEDTFSWRGGKFPLRTNETHFRTRRSVVTDGSKRYQRRDEPEQGSLVIVEHIALLDQYLIGSARRPFRDPRKYYILVVRHIEPEWKEQASLVMERLWKDYGIINALIMAPCADSGEEVCLRC